MGHRRTAYVCMADLLADAAAHVLQFFGYTHEDQAALKQALNAAKWDFRCQRVQRVGSM